MVIHVTDDLDLDRIAESGQCFRWQKTEENTYRIIAGSYCLYISSLGGGGFELDCSGEEFECFWSDYFDLSENYREIRARIDPVSDPFLWQAAEHEKGIRILRQDPWEMLISFIISQNKNIPAIRRSIELLAETCGEKRTDRRGEAYYAFPGPKAVASLSEEELKGCRLGYRCKYVHAAAEAVAGGKIDLEELAGERDRLSGEDRLPGRDRMPGKKRLPGDDQLPGVEDRAIAALTGLFGVGVKVANCVSLFGLHHVDAFPIDVWVKRILETEYPDGYPYERYSPYNGICQQYMFAWYRHKE